MESRYFPPNFLFASKPACSGHRQGPRPQRSPRLRAASGSRRRAGTRPPDSGTALRVLRAVRKDTTGQRGAGRQALAHLSLSNDTGFCLKGQHPLAPHWELYSRGNDLITAELTVLCFHYLNNDNQLQVEK